MFYEDCDFDLSFETLFLSADFDFDPSFEILISPLKFCSFLLTSCSIIQLLQCLRIPPPRFLKTCLPMTRREEANLKFETTI